jgi:hypothetical protein
MFTFLKKLRNFLVIKEKVYVDAQVEKIKNLLFPELIFEENNNETYVIDRSMLSLLTAVLVDIKENNVDAHTINNLIDSINVLLKIKELLQIED